MARMPVDDPRWCAMLEAIQLLAEHVGDRDMAIFELEQAIDSGKLRGMYKSFATGERGRLTTPCDLFAWFYATDPNLDDLLYRVWRPGLDALLHVSSTGSSGVGDSKGRVKRDGRQVARVKELLSIAFPDSGAANAKIKEIQQRFGPLCEERNWEIPKADSISRALGRRR